MKNTVLSIFMLISVLLCAGEFSVVDVFSADRYEDACTRVGSPRLLKGNVAPGLLVETGMGVYETDSSVEIALKKDQFIPPQGGRIRLVHALRVYGFSGAASAVSTTLVGVDRKLTVTIDSPVGGKLNCRVEGDAVKEAVKMEVAEKSLPVDFAFYIADNGAFTLSATGLADSSKAVCEGSTTLFTTLWKPHDGYRPLSIKTIFAPIRPGNRAAVTVDEHYVGLAAPAEKTDVPCIVKPKKRFDPVKAGWPLVFADEFEGDGMDWSEWHYSGRNCDTFGKHARVDGKGVLEIEADYDERGERLETARLMTKRAFLYGYFEAKVKLTRQNGWWAAFWLFGGINSDPFVDGSEIDIFEDYYTRKITPEGRNRKQLDHNLHMYLGDQLKSWNYSEDLAGSVDDWVVIGCKWTPFEISYYVDGRLVESAANHSNWPSVTYDAFNHGVIATPLHMIVSGQVMDKSWRAYDKSNAVFPEAYKVDYVRAYAMPCEKAKMPRISWAGDAAEDDGRLKFFKEGEKMRFEVDASPATGTGEKINAVYLFDAGYLVGFKTEPPYVFDVEMTREWYSKTRYMATGRQKVVPDFTKAPHSFVAFAQDRSGAVSSTSPAIRRHPRFLNPATRPFENEAQKLPGRIVVWRYDEGGEGVAYHDTTKGNAYGTGKSGRRMEGDVDCTSGELASVMPYEWVNYTVDIAKEGSYRAEMRYGTAHYGHHDVYVVVDGEAAGVFSFDYSGHAGKWTINSKSVIENIRLPAGRHVVSLYFHSQLNVGSIEFVENKR